MEGILEEGIYRQLALTRFSTTMASRINDPNPTPLRENRATPIQSHRIYREVRLFHPSSGNFVQPAVPQAQRERRSQLGGLSPSRWPPSGGLSFFNLPGGQSLPAPPHIPAPPAMKTAPEKIPLPKSRIAGRYQGSDSERRVQQAWIGGP